MYNTTSSKKIKDYINSLFFVKINNGDIMIYITGDKHRHFEFVESFCKIHKTSKNDIMIVLGDAGINYFLNKKDYELKDVLSEFPITLFCIHGNHEERPENIDTYKTKLFHDGIVYYEEAYPNILFAKDGEIYDFNGLKTLVIGGAYSRDKTKRLKLGPKWNYYWYPSEQPSEEIKNRVRKTLIENDNTVNIILSHTCPYKKIQPESIDYTTDQSTIDYSTEYFLDEIEENTDYDTWYCGHQHIDKHVDRIRFMHDDYPLYDADVMNAVYAWVLY